MDPCRTSNCSYNTSERVAPRTFPTVPSQHKCYNSYNLKIHGNMMQFSLKMFFEFTLIINLLWTLIFKLGCHYSCTSHATIECRKANGFKYKVKKKWVVFVSFGFSSCFWEAFLLSENQTYARRSLQNGFFPPSAQDSQDILSKTSPSVT